MLVIPVSSISNSAVKKLLSVFPDRIFPTNRSCPACVKLPLVKILAENAWSLAKLVFASIVDKSTLSPCAALKSTITSRFLPLSESNTLLK